MKKKTNAKTYLIRCLVDAALREVEKFVKPRSMRSVLIATPREKASVLLYTCAIASLTRITEYESRFAFEESEMTQTHSATSNLMQSEAYSIIAASAG